MSVAVPSLLLAVRRWALLTALASALSSAGEQGHQCRAHVGDGQRGRGQAAARDLQEGSTPISPSSLAAQR